MFDTFYFVLSVVVEGINFRRGIVFFMNQGNERILLSRQCGKSGTSLVAGAWFWETGVRGRWEWFMLIFV